MDLSTLITHLAERAPGFAARLDAANLKPGDIRRPTDLHALPIIRKENLIEIQAAQPPFGGYLACAPDELKRIFQSPGPISDPESRIADYWRWAPALRAAGFQPGDLVMNAFGYHLTPAGAMFEEGLWAIGCTVLPGGIGNQEQQVQMLHTLHINGYVGLPSYLKALLDKSEQLGLLLRIQKAFVTAEPLPPSLRAYLNDHGIVVRQGYGTAECGNLGYECDEENGWHIPDDALVDVCDIVSGQPLPPGETGEIVATLLNPDYAFVRFGLGDLSSLNINACPCGRSTPRLMGWQGRIGDAVKVRGMFLHAPQLQQLMSRFSEVTRWQAVVTRCVHKDHLALRIVPAPEADVTTLPERLVQTAHESIKFQPTIEIVAPDVLPTANF